MMTSSTYRRGAAVPCVVLMLLVVQGCQQGGRGDGGTSLATTSGALTQDAVVPTGSTCTPAGKHGEHSRFACSTCHQCAGTLAFDPSLAGPTAAFDATTKNCTNVACHAVPAGTFTYNTYDWSTEQVVPVTVPYGGAEGGAVANWYAAGGATCGACHGYPPRYNGNAYPWHSGAHGGTIINGNTCQLCHPDATGAYVYGGPPSYAATSGGLIAYCAPATYCSAPGTITNGSLHGNGVVDVQPSWNGNCFGCH